MKILRYKKTLKTLRSPVLWVSGLALLGPWRGTRLLRAAQENPGAQVEQHFRAARQAEKARDFDQAAAEYQAILRITPNQALVLNNLGLVYHLQGKYRPAIETFQKAIKYDPNLLGAQVVLGIDYIRTSQFQKAVAPLKTAVRLNPKDVQAHLYLGRCYFDLGQYDESLREVRTAATLQPRDADILHTLGQVYGKLMSTTYLEMSEVNPDSFLVHQTLAESYDAQKSPEKAVEEYKAAIARSPSTPGLHYALGDVLWRALKFKEAEEEFLAELRISPEDYVSLWKIGNISLYYGRWDEAISWIEKSIAIDPQLAQAHRDLGKAYFEKNELEKAVTEYLKVIEIAPDEDTVHYRLAVIYRRQGRPKQAQAEMEIFEKLNKKPPGVQTPSLPGAKPEDEQ